MDPYDPFARFYDALERDPVARLSAVRSVVARHCPSATAVLELGCGTGAILAGLGELAERTGVERSDAMLSIARERAPGATLVHADMATYRAGRRFDLVLCVFDTLNHLVAADEWSAVFARTAEHLAAGGIFHLDVNTVGRLRRLAAGPPWVHDFDGNTLVMEVHEVEGMAPPAQVRTDWRIRVFEPLHGRRYTLHETTVTELGIPLAELAERLGRHFTVIECVDRDGSPATDESDRAYLTCARLAG